MIGTSRIKAAVQYRGGSCGGGKGKGTKSRSRRSHSKSRSRRHGC